MKSSNQVTLYLIRLRRISYFAFSFSFFISIYFHVTGRD